MSIAVVLATCREWPDLSESDRLYADALAARGADVRAAPWNGPLEPFLGAGLVVLRATWDYHRTPDAYAAWLTDLEQRGIAVRNVPELVLWNLDKGYLGALGRASVPVPATNILANDPATVERFLEERDWERAVIKPAIGASGHAVRLVRRGAVAAALAEVEGPSRLLVQEFMPEVRETGELACIFFAGAFSHAVVRRPAAGDFRVNSQYDGTVGAAAPTAGIIAQARAVLDRLPALPLYARVDGVVRDGAFVLMELELNEPALFLQHAPGSADRFAEATLREETARARA